MLNMLPLVSVIVPNYNHSQYLGKRLSSVIGQTYSNFELIILDDCSNDDSMSVINQFREHPKVTHVVENRVNSGSAFLQWKKGLELSQGDWVWIAESDDYADREFLTRMLSTTVQEDVGMMYCDSWIVTEEQVMAKTFADIKNERLKTNRWSMDYVNGGLEELQKFLLPYGTINNTSAVLFRRSTLMKIDPFDQKFQFIGDKYAFTKMLAVSNIAYVAQPMNYYRNPFNDKHRDKSIYYFLEQFKIFDWVDRNVRIDRSDFLQAFSRNTQNSLVRGWNQIKFSIYWRAFKINPRLWFICLMNNFFRTFTIK